MAIRYRWMLCATCRTTGRSEARSHPGGMTPTGSTKSGRDVTILAGWEQRQSMFALARALPGGRKVPAAGASTLVRGRVRRSRWATARKSVAGRALAAVALLGLVWLSASTAVAATNQFRGVNWADPRDNFQSGVVYISGLSVSDTNSSATAVAGAVMDQFISELGANSVRLPINEATVAQYWNTYTGAIDTVASKGNVILCFWSSSSGAKPPDMTAYWNMWSTVVTKYAGNSHVYFEVFNEPSGYSQSDLGTLYESWLTQFSTVPRGRVILDGQGLAQNVPAIASDSRFDGCLLAVHEYTFFGSTAWTTEAQWTSHFSGEVGAYSDRTVCTEWGAPMSPGSKNGIQYGTQDYDSPPGSYFVAYTRAVSAKLRAWNMGSFLWPGLRDGDWYSMTVKTGTGANITLSVANKTGLDQLQNAWGGPLDGGASPATDGGTDAGGSIDGGRDSGSGSSASSGSSGSSATASTSGGTNASSTDNPTSSGTASGSTGAGGATGSGGSSDAAGGESGSNGRAGSSSGGCAVRGVHGADTGGAAALALCVLGLVAARRRDRRTCGRVEPEVARECIQRTFLE